MLRTWHTQHPGSVPLSENLVVEPQEGWKWKWKSLSRVWLFATPWTMQSREFSRPECWSGLPFPSPRDLLNPRTEPKSPTLQVDSLPAEPQGKPKNTGGGSLFLLQWIFPTQGSNSGLSHCRWILYQLSHKGSPRGMTQYKWLKWKWTWAQSRWWGMVGIFESQGHCPHEFCCSSWKKAKPPGYGGRTSLGRPG